MDRKRKVMILGGAGFIGSHIVGRFLDAGDAVVVVDGLLPQTGGKRDHMSPYIGKVEFFESRIEDMPDLEGLVEQCDLYVDSMAWTSHLGGLKNPLHDLKLNTATHIYLLSALKEQTGKPVIHLGSRSQYGRYDSGVITEDSPMIPSDVQGIHKLAGESLYRVYSGVMDIPVRSLRLPGCFGENQPTTGVDVGLVGNFIRMLMRGEEVEVYGQGRKRNLLYAKDVAEAVYLLSRDVPPGFEAFNMAGRDITVEHLVERLITFIGRGSFSIREMPRHLEQIEMGSAVFNDDRLHATVGRIERTPFEKAMRRTVDYFKANRI